MCICVSSDIFSNVCCDVSEVRVMTRQKCHVFDSEKVGRYMFMYSAGLSLCFEATIANGSLPVTSHKKYTVSVSSLAFHFDHP